MEVGHAALVEQGLSVIDQFKAMPGWLYSADLRAVTANTFAELQAGLWPLAEERFECELLVLIGHSSQEVLRIGSTCPDRMKWTAVASCFRPFAPRKLLVLGCNAAQWMPCKAMFQGIPELREVVGSPVELSGRTARVLPIAVPFLLARRIDPAWISIMQLAAFVGGDILVRRTRPEFERTANEFGDPVAAFERVLSELVRAVRR